MGEKKQKESLMINPTIKAGEFIKSNLDDLSSEVMALQFQKQPHLEEKYSQKDKDICLQDIHYHLSYLSDALEVEEPLLFKNYLGWVKGLFQGLNIPEEAMLVNLRCLKEVMSKHLHDGAGNTVLTYIEEAEKVYQTEFPSHDTFIKKSQPLFSQASDYLKALLSGDRKKASDIVLDLDDAGESVKSIYLNIFQPVQREVGRLWQMNKINVAQEHFCTAVTQMVMSKLYPKVFATPKTGKTFLGTSINDELHEIGIRMVTDLLELEGWDTYYLGANTPPQSLVQMLIETDADLVGLSATMTFHLENAKRLIRMIRNSKGGSKRKIIVGGYVFNSIPNLYRKIGADGWAPDAKEAVQLANSLVQS